MAVTKCARCEVEIDTTKGSVDFSRDNLPIHNNLEQCVDATLGHYRAQLAKLESLKRVEQQQEKDMELAKKEAKDAQFKAEHEAEAKHGQEEAQRRRLAAEGGFSGEGSRPFNVGTSRQTEDEAAKKAETDKLEQKRHDDNRLAEERRMAEKAEHGLTVDQQKAAQKAKDEQDADARHKEEVARKDAEARKAMAQKNQAEKDKAAAAHK